jgi:flagellar assembly factor FliW
VKPLLTVQSQILGTLHVAEEQIFNFPAGIFGFPDARSFAFLPAEREGFYWLQCVQDPPLAFILVDPFVFFDGYAVDVGAADLADLQVAGASEVAIFAIVTLPASPGGSPTANLQGPVALNLPSRRGKQLALQDGKFGVRCRFDPARPPLEE